MRVFLDSNILFSALISPAGPPHRIHEAWRARRFVLITCQIQMDEIRRASRYPKFRTILQPHRVGRTINNLGRAETVDTTGSDHETDDPHDVWLLALANAGQADYLVTGDKRAGLLSRGHIGATRILTATAFCQYALREVH